MSNTPHELAEEFPNDLDKIHALKAEDAHFAKMVDEYHEVNGKIHLAETHVKPSTPEHEEELRKIRLKLKDAIAARLRQA